MVGRGKHHKQVDGIRNALANMNSDSDRKSKQAARDCLNIAKSVPLTDANDRAKFVAEYRKARGG